MRVRLTRSASISRDSRDTECVKKKREREDKFAISHQHVHRRWPLDKFHEQGNSSELREYDRKVKKRMKKKGRRKKQGMPILAFLWPRSRIFRGIAVSTSQAVRAVRRALPLYRSYQNGPFVSAFMEPAYSVEFRFTASCRAINRRSENEGSSRRANEFAMFSPNTS